MNLLYNTGIRTYRLLARVASGYNAKVSKMCTGQGETFARLEQARRHVAPDGFDVWFHAASLGEFEQARPVIEALKRHHPQTKILLSFFSPSGYEVRKDYDRVDCVVYLPFDTPANARRFVELAAPRKVVFVKYEFWGNYLQALRRAAIPTYLISATFRPGQVFFKPWGGMMRDVLRCFSHIYVQEEASQRLLQGIGYEAVTVAGDTRFDRVTDVMRATFDVPSLSAWTATREPVLIAGSSWPADEAIYIPWLKAHRDVKAIIAPHEFDDDRLKALKAELGDKAVLWSEIKDEEAVPDDTQFIIIDCFGILSSLYRYGTVALIGGGFGAGIHNINEAAVYGLPVIFGPKHQKFHEAQGLIECGGGWCYHDDVELDMVLTRLFSDDDYLKQASQAASSYIKSHLGASRVILNEVFEVDDKA